MLGSRRQLRPLEAHAATLEPRGRRSALVLGDHRQSLAVARSLHRAGYRVIAGRGGGRTILERSRHVAEVWDHPPEADLAAWGASLQRFCAEREDVRIVFPVGDREIERTSPLADRLPVLVVAARTLLPCSNKRVMLTMAESLGVPTQKWETVNDPYALEAAIERVGLPAVLKPDGSTEAFRFKAIIIRSAADAGRIAKRLPRRAGGLVLQQFAAGTRHNVYFVSTAGRLLGSSHVRILRTDRPDGTGLAVEGDSVAPNPALGDWTAALAARLSYTGAGCAQFVVDELGRTTFLEINARLGANCAATCRCGLDLPRLFVEALMGAADEQAPPQVGRRYAWLHGDLEGLKSSLGSRTLTWTEAAIWFFRMVMAQIRAHDHITWSWHDPLPTLTIHARWLQAGLRGLLRRITVL